MVGDATPTEQDGPGVPCCLPRPCMAAMSCRVGSCARWCSSQPVRSGDVTLIPPRLRHSPGARIVHRSGIRYQLADRTNGGSPSVSGIGSLKGVPGEGPGRHIGEPKIKPRGRRVPASIRERTTMITELLRRRAIKRNTRELRTMIRQAPSQSVRNDLLAIAAREQHFVNRRSVEQFSVRE